MIWFEVTMDLIMEWRKNGLHLHGTQGRMALAAACRASFSSRLAQVLSLPFRERFSATIGAVPHACAVFAINGADDTSAWKQKRVI
jgi:hypothetical protein